MHYITLILPKIQTILRLAKTLQSTCLETCPWNSIHVKKKSHIHFFWRKIGIEGEKSKDICPQVKVKTKCLFSLTVGLQLSAYCWVDLFLSTHPALQKTQPLCQDICLQRAYVAMAISCSPGNQGSSTLWYIHECCLNSDSSLRHRSYPATSIPIFTCCNVKHQAIFDSS